MKDFRTNVESLKDGTAIQDTLQVAIGHETYFAVIEVTDIYVYEYAAVEADYGSVKCYVSVDLQKGGAPIELRFDEYFGEDAKFAVLGSYYWGVNREDWLEALGGDASEPAADAIYEAVKRIIKDTLGSELRFRSVDEAVVREKLQERGMVISSRLPHASWHWEVQQNDGSPVGFFPSLKAIQRDLNLSA